MIGEQDNEYALKITKDWGDITESLKSPVTVYLKAGDTVLDPVVLNTENNWAAAFTQLPSPASLINDFSYSVVENPVPDYFEPSYSEAQTDADTPTIANAYQPKPDDMPEAGGISHMALYSMPLLFSSAAIAGAVLGWKKKYSK